MCVLSTIFVGIPSRVLLTAVFLTSICIGLSYCGAPTDNEQIEIEKLTFCGDKTEAGKDQSGK